MQVRFTFIKSKILVVIWLIIISPLVMANDHRSEIYQAYLASRMDLWKEAMEQIERCYIDGRDSGLLYDLAEAQYGYIAFCISMDRKKEAGEVLEKAERNIGILADKDPFNPKVFSLMGALHGFRVRLEPVKALVYVRRSKIANDRAIVLGPEEPQAWMEKANMEFYTPRLLGGSVKNAVLLYEKAVRLFEASPERTHQNWLYLNCLAGLGLAYERSGRVSQAGTIYRKLLDLEPSFAWVRDDLYPEFLEKHSIN